MADDGDLARIVEFLWRDHDDPGRATRPQLNADTIIGVAIAIADADGLDRVSMQRIGEALGYTAMGLYRHVPSKAELIMAMTDSAYGLPPQRPGTGGWRTEIESWVTALWRVYQAHPWTVQVPTRGAPIGPNELAWFEALVRPLAGAGVGDLDTIMLATFLSSAVRDLARITVELDADQAAYERLLAERLDPERFPTLNRLFGHDTTGDGTADLTPAVQTGLQRLLDGIEHHLHRSPTRKGTRNRG